MASMETSITSVNVYFAYAPRDKALQEELEMQLGVYKRKGYIASWNKDEVLPGKEPMREIAAHLQYADVILLLISPHFINSDFCWNIEMMKALKRHEKEEACVIPIIIRPTADWKEAPFGNLQALPRDKKAVDTWKNRLAIFEEIAYDIRKAIEALQLHRSRKRGYESTRYLPPALPSSVQRRSMIVKQIYKRLTQLDTTALVLTGMGGAGKTTLATLVYHYAKKQSQAGKVPFTAEPLWVAINQSFTMADLIKCVFDALGRPLSDFSSLTPQEQAKLLFHALDAVDKPRLVILDQFEHFLDAQTGQALPDHPGVHEWLGLLNSRTCACRVLLISRLYPHVIPGYLSESIGELPIPKMEMTESIILLRDLLQALDIKSTKSELQTTVQQCGGDPLTLRMLVTLLESDKNLNMTVFLNDPRYDQSWKGAIAPALLNTIYQHQLDKAQRSLLLAFSVFREPVPLEATRAIVEFFTKAPVSFEQLLPIQDTLRNRYLLEDAGLSRYQLHPIVASYARDHFDEKNEQANHLTLPAAHAKAAEFYQQQAEKTCPPRKQRKNLLDFHDFVEATWHWCRAECQKTAYELICKEELFADIQRCGGNTTLFELYRSLIPSETWQPEPIQAAQIYNEFGEIQRTLGQKREAQSNLKKALSLFQGLRNLEGQVKTLNNLGAVYRNLGQLERALSCYQQALQTCDMMVAPYLHGKAAALNNMGVISFYVGQKEHALKFFEQALVIQHTINDQDEEARTLVNIGKVYDIQKKRDEAHQKYLEALHIFQEIGDREGLATVYNHIGVSCMKKPEQRLEKKLEQRQEAEEYHILALSIFQEIGDREQEATTLQHLGRLSFFHEIDKNSRTREDFEEPLAFYLYARQIFRELQIPEKGEIPKLITDELQSQLGAEQLGTLIAAIEPRARQLVEQALRKDYPFS